MRRTTEQTRRTQSELDDHEERIRELESEVKNHEERITDNTKNIQRNEISMTQLKLNRILDNQQIDQNKSDMAKFQSDIRNVSSRTIENKNYISDIKNDLNDINNNILDLKSDNDTNQREHCRASRKNLFY
jgi:chromosome segregation ATPase